MENITTYNRPFCILCDNNSQLLDITTTKIPLYITCPSDSVNHLWNMKYGYCEKCFSVQLKTLLDPNILYDKHYIQPNPKSYNWVQHNISFIQFIVSCFDIRNPLTEIGSSSFVLGEHLTQYYKDYTVFDYSLEQAVRRDNVKYIEGNCETYDFGKNANIIMSHVFEHLYEPQLFIKNCKKSGVENIVISIPCMNNLNDLYVFNQHTFLYSENDIEYIFGLHNYKSIKHTTYNVNDGSFPCFFFHFVLQEAPVIIDRTIIINRHLFMQNILKPITVPKNTIIATAGMMALTFYSLITNQENVVGIIDANSALHGKLFGATEHLIQSYESLLYHPEYNTSDANILVFGYRKPDIIACIRKINGLINIIEL